MTTTRKSTYEQTVLLWLTGRDIRRDWLGYLTSAAYMLVLGSLLAPGFANDDVLWGPEIAFLAMVFIMTQPFFSRDYMSWENDRVAARLTFLLFLLLLVGLAGPLIAGIPLAAIEVLLLYVAWQLIDVPRIRMIARFSRGDAITLGATWIATMTIRIELAILLGMALALGFYLDLSSRPALRRMVPWGPRRRFTPISQIDEPVRECPQLLLARMEGAVYFAAIGGAGALLAQRVKKAELVAYEDLGAEAIRRLQPVDVTLEQVTRLAPALTGVDRCVALLIDDEGNFRARTVQGQRPGLAEAYRDAVIRPGELPLLDDACRSGQPIFVDDVEGSARVPRSWRTRFGSRTILVVPLLVADEPIGALLADDVDSAHMFSPRRVRILVGIANQAAIAIENARLQLQEAERARLGRELELAQEIQRTLLPQAAPDVPGYQVAYRWRSARQVGGDFFDFMRLDPSRIGLVIADVSDKGIPAALYMMFARTIMRAVALSGRDPAQALQRANQLILSDSTSDMFVTAHYGVLHAASHRLVYSSAGHNLALHVRAAGGHIEELTASGLALGIVDDVQFEQKTIDLAEGDVILFYTDGAIDTLDPGGAEFGSDRLAALLSEHRSLSAESIAEEIDSAVHAWAAGEPQYDDFTLIVVKRDATNDVAPG